MALIAQVASKAREENPLEKLAHELAPADPVAWARESERAAREVAYMDGRLRCITKAEADLDRDAAAPDLPNGYAERTRELARRRIALSGYRLGTSLNSILDD